MNSDKGGLISFALTESDKKWKKKAEQPGFIGHPPWKEWFCEVHYEIAKKYSHLTLPEAMGEIGKQVG